MKPNLRKLTSLTLFLLLAFMMQDAFSQCATSTSLTNMGTITPTTTPKFVTASAGTISSWTFNAVAGKTYQFNNCNGTFEDTYMAIMNSAWVELKYGDDDCGTGGGLGAMDVAHGTAWTCSTTGTYTFFIGQWPCVTLGYNQRVDYWSDYNPYYNDAGVSAVVSPATPVAGGVPTNVIVKLTNFGLANLTSAGVKWNVDGGTVNTYTAGWTGTLTPSQQSANITIGSGTFTSGTHVLKAWTYSPNGVTDSFKGNDTCIKSFNVCSTVGGTYVIDKKGTGNFTTFADAIAAMTGCGLNAAITFIVKPGIYNERVVIPQISGASATNTITFDGLNSDSVKITYAGVSSASRATVVLNGADYVTFNNMTIENTGTSYQTAILLTNVSDYNTVKNCKLKCAGNNSSNFYVAVIGMSETSFTAGTNNPASFNVFSDNLIYGGYYGAYLYSGNNSVYGLYNKFIRNNFDNQYQYGMSNNNQMGLLVQNNYFHNFTSTSAYGIYGYWNTMTTYDGNKINPGQYGIFLYYENVNNSGNKSLVINNAIYGFKNTSYQTGIQTQYYGGYLDILHNSIWVNGTAAFSAGSSYQYSAIFLYYYAQNTNIKNNILTSTGTTLLLSAIYYPQNTIQCDYNSYYYPGSTSDKFYWYTSTSSASQYHPNLAQFQLNSNNINPNHDLNSVEQINPNFVSSTDLHLSSGNVPLYGKWVGVGKDVDGNTRCVMSPTIGADESTYPYPVANPDFTYPDTIYAANQVDFLSLNSRTIPYQYKWSLNGTAATKDTLHDFTHIFASAGSNTVKSVVTGCTSKDSTSHTFNVINALRAPKAQFSTNSNIVTIFDPLSLKDLSRFGPDTWTWKITPDQFYNSISGLMEPTYSFSGTSSINSQNPSLFFLAAGNFTVSLVVSNALGVDSTIKNDYIIVMPDISLCTGEYISNNNYGKLYDDGGKTTNYSNYMACKFLITPCSPKLKLIVRSFSLASGDYLKIYDGTNATGKPVFNATTSPSGFTGTIAPNTTFTSTSGKFYMEFNTDGATNSSGFELEWIADSLVSTPPVASFDIPDTICLDKSYLFKNTSTGYGNKYYWDLNRDGIPDNQPNEEDISADYSAPFSDTVMLAVENCGGVDTLYKLITANAPTFKPTVGFYVNNTVPNTKTDIVKFYDTSYRCVDTWTWEFTPNYVTFKNGTNKNSNVPEVVFDSIGCYNVKLVASANGFVDSLEKTCYINALSYCIPTINTYMSDIGISNVKIGTINNPSTILPTAYNNYSSTNSTNLVRGQQTSIEIKRSTSFNSMSIAVWIDYNLNGSFNDPGERVAYTASSASLIWNANFTVPFTAALGAARMRISTNSANKPNLACGTNRNGEFEDYKVILINDNDKPVITLVGSDTVVVEEWNRYVEKGAIATDLTEGNISSSIRVTGIVDSSKFGIYYKKYNCTDIAGNKAAEVIRVVVVSPDKTAPIISLVGGDTIIEVNGIPAYVDPGYSAFDPPLMTVYTSSVTKTGSVDQSKLGLYKLSYSVTDIAGNTANKSRNVTVVDSKAPVLTLLGLATITIDVNTTYSEPGYTVTDNYWKNLVVDVTGTVNPAKTGTYILKYSCTDSSANLSAILSRTVIVQDTTKPVITLIGMDTITIEAGTSYLDPGANVSDNYCLNATKPNLSGSVNINLLGKYTLTYNITDCEGNIGKTLKRIVNVVDTKAPEIALNGHPVFKMIKHQPYTEDGYTVSDKYWPLSQITIDTLTDFVSTNFVGIFYIQYKATDGSGNVALTEKRIIYVNNFNGIDTKEGEANNLLAYPNPANNSVKIYVSLEQLQAASIVIYDVFGNEIQKVYTGKISDKVFDLNVSSYTKGIYFIKLSTKDNQLVHKLIVN